MADYNIVVTPYNKREVLWQVALSATPNKILAQDVMTWATEEAAKDVREWITANIPDGMQVNKEKAAREALGETQYLVNLAEREAKQYARLHAGFSRNITYTPPTV